MLWAGCSGRGSPQIGMEDPALGRSDADRGLAMASQGARAGTTYGGRVEGGRYIVVPPAGVLAMRGGIFRHQLGAHGHGQSCLRGRGSTEAGERPYYSSFHKDSYVNS